MGKLQRSKKKEITYQVKSVRNNKQLQKFYSLPIAYLPIVYSAQHKKSHTSPLYWGTGKISHYYCISNLKA